MTTPPNPNEHLVPPLVCPNCAAHQLHHPLDRDRMAFYCPHRRVLAVRDPKRARWITWQGVDQAQYRQIVGACEVDARVLAEHGLTYSLERGVHRPDLTPPAAEE